ncbi:MAG TPA: ankyrin repeat domain-containing protein [Actinomycetota bacterium]|nr:ankyrin repeat domain-containing protein [Actinomycetota bacterium]
MASTRAVFEAIEADDAAAVARLLAEDPALASARDDHGVSALMRARYRSDEAVIGAIRDRLDDLDVFEAAAFGEVGRLGELLDGDPALTASYSGDGFTALHFAAFFGRPDAVGLLLARGAEVDAFGRGWMTGTALHSAVSRGHADNVRLLLDAGASPDVRQSHGWTPLHAAAHNGDVASLEALLAAGADPAATNDEGRSVLDLAEEGGDQETIERVRAALQDSP